MSDVTRYETISENAGSFSGFKESDVGNWVKYSDHLAAMEAKDLEIEGLRNRVNELESALSKCSLAISGHHEVIAVEKIVRIIKKVSKEPK